MNNLLRYAPCLQLIGEHSAQKIPFLFFYFLFIICFMAALILHLENYTS